MESEVKKYSVIIHDSATEMLIEHVRFMAQVSETAALRLVDEFYISAKSLENMPERCPWLSGYLFPEKKYRKHIFEKHYMLIFQTIGDKVYVDAMIDCRSDYSWLL